MVMSQTKMSVFDFDGTLIDTPLPDTGKDIYQQKTGKEWPHAGWWGRAESLDTDVFEMPVIKDVIKDYNIEAKTEGTLVVMLTGRIKRLESQVKNVLRTKNLVFDDYIFNNGGSTDVSKIKSLNALLEAHPTIEMVEMWEDRLAHVPIFEEWGKEQCLSGRLKDFKINVVTSDHH